MNDRIKNLRKALGLSQEAFAKKLGMKGSAISLLESGKRNLTDQNIKAICREFNVDYLWLTTGQGEMFIQDDETALELIDRVMSGESEFAKNIFKAFARLDTKDWQDLERLAYKLLGKEKRD